MSDGLVSLVARFVEQRTNIPSSVAEKGIRKGATVGGSVATKLATRALEAKTSSRTSPP
jgi:hypothetical protein